MEVGGRAQLAEALDSLDAGDACPARDYLASIGLGRPMCPASCQYRARAGTATVRPLGGPEWLCRIEALLEVVGPRNGGPLLPQARKVPAYVAVGVRREQERRHRDDKIGATWDRLASFHGDGAIRELREGGAIPGRVYMYQRISTVPSPSDMGPEDLLRAGVLDPDWVSSQMDRTFPTTAVPPPVEYAADLLDTVAPYRELVRHLRTKARDPRQVRMLDLLATMSDWFVGDGRKRKDITGRDETIREGLRRGYWCSFGEGKNVWDSLRGRAKRWRENHLPDAPRDPEDVDGLLESLRWVAGWTTWPARKCRQSPASRP